MCIAHLLSEISTLNFKKNTNISMDEAPKYSFKEQKPDTWFDSIYGGSPKGGFPKATGITYV